MSAKFIEPCSDLGSCCYSSANCEAARALIVNLIQHELLPKAALLKYSQKSISENMQLIYNRTAMPKSNFSKFA